MKELPKKPKRVLILGHTGFLGGRLWSLLSRELPGAALIGASSTGRALPGGRAYRCDLRDARAAARLLRRARPDWVFDLAGRAAGEDAPMMVESHLLTTASLLQAAASLPRPWPRVVLAGSAAEYGTLPRGLLPLSESAPLRPVTAYGAVKVGQSALARVFALRGLPVTVARIFNVLGPGLHAGLVAASFARQIALIERGSAPPLLRTGNLAPKRDFVDVADVCRALLLLARGGRPGEPYNVCSGRSVSIRDLLRGLLALSPARVRVAGDPRRKRGVDIPDIFGSSARIRRELGWRPTVPLQSSLKAMLDHERGLP